MNERSVKMADVARESGVSVTTVSLVLRNKPGITSETRQRVMNTARLLGYRLKESSLLQTNGGPKNVGLIIKSQPGFIPQSNPFYSYVISAIEAYCRQRQINLLYAAMPVDEDNYPAEVPHLFQNENIDGYLLVGAFVDETLNHVLGETSAPVVLVDAYAASNQYDAVVSDNFNGAYEAISHLIAKGHRHIGLIGSHPNAYPSFVERRRGYRRALQDHQIQESYFADCPIDAGKAFDATTALLKEHPEISALFGINDEMAIAAMRTVNALGKRIPQDFSVIGFDDIPLAEHMMPPLTTMQIDKVSMGRIAMLLLAHRIEIRTCGNVTAMLRPRLVERNSVGEPGDKRFVKSNSEV